MLARSVIRFTKRQERQVTMHEAEDGPAVHGALVAAEYPQPCFT